MIPSFLQFFRRPKPLPDDIRIAIYSNYFGKHEPLNTSSMGKWVNVDKFIFTTDPDLQYPGAEVVVLPDDGKDPKIQTRRFKINPHQYFSEYDWVIQIDNRASVRVHPVEIIAKIREWEKDSNWAGRYLFRHPERDCAYDEAKACVETGVLSEHKEREIAAFFESQRFPRNNGLFVNTMMVQKMGDVAADRFNETWYDLVQTLCYRDQVSLSYALWKSGYRPRILPFEYSQFIDWPVFSDEERKQFRATNNFVFDCI